MSFAWKMNILGETWTCKLLCCLARDRKSTPKFHYTKRRCWCFHRSWFGEEKSVIQISWFLDLFWRWEEKIRFLRNDVFHFLFIRLHWLSKQTTRQPRISFVIEDHRRKIPKNGFLRMLIDSGEYSIYCYLLTFGKQSMLIGSELYSIVTYVLSEN